jgi:hypothetical protein
MGDSPMQTIQQFPSWFSKQKLSGKVAIGCASLFMLCCLCSVPMAILSPPTATSEMTKTVVVEVSPSQISKSAIPTETTAAEVVPTETIVAAVLPTDTIIPTIAPSNTPAPTPSQEILTIENNEDMARLFKAGDFDPFVSEFAKKYSGRNIQFDGYIAYMTPHEGYKTRFDILIYTGNYGKPSGNALSFKFEDINIVSDLKLTGSNIPESISVDQNLRITAKVEEYKEASGLFFLKPVSTEIRPTGSQ